MRTRYRATTTTTRIDAISRACIGTSLLHSPLLERVGRERGSAWLIFGYCVFFFPLGRTSKAWRRHRILSWGRDLRRIDLPSWREGLTKGAPAYTSRSFFPAFCGARLINVRNGMGTAAAGISRDCRGENTGRQSLFFLTAIANLNLDFDTMNMPWH